MTMLRGLVQADAFLVASRLMFIALMGCSADDAASGNQDGAVLADGGGTDASVHDAMMADGMIPMNDAMMADGTIPMNDAMMADGTIPMNDAMIADGTIPMNDAMMADGTIPMNDASAEERCTASGGTVRMALCCGFVVAFPNTCLTGACGCAPQGSHQVMTCDCSGENCWDGERCGPRVGI